MTRPLHLAATAPWLGGDSAPLALSLRWVATVAVLSAAGEIDLATAPAFEREACRVLRDAHGRLIIDLSETTFMDLSGVRAAERLGHYAQALGGQLAVVAVTRGVRLALHHLPLREALVTHSLSAAVEALVDLDP